MIESVEIQIGRPLAETRADRQPGAGPDGLALQPEHRDVLALHRSLLDGSYEPYPYRQHVVCDPKDRLMSIGVQREPRHRWPTPLATRTGDSGARSCQSGPNA